MATIFHDPGNRQLLSELWAVVSVDDQGEGIVAAGVLGLGMTPLVTGDPDRVDILWALAKAEPQLRGKQLRVVRFSRAGVLKYP